MASDGNETSFQNDGQIAYRNGYIDANQLERLALKLGSSGYGQYLLEILQG